MNQPLTAVSLFAGVGGFDLAFEQAGIRTVAAVEIDKHARGVLRHRFPETVLFDDVNEVTSEQLLSAGFIPERGIIAGGFPCQPFSVAGRRLGMAEDRGLLYWQISRLAKELQPRWLILENVPGLLSSDGGRTMGIILTDLANIGYVGAYRVLDSQNFGVPQRRRRVFIVASRAGTCDYGPATILLEPEGCRGNLAAGNQAWQKTPQHITDSIGTSSANGVTFSKSRRAASVDDYETWIERDNTNTLNTFDNAADTRATELIIEPTVTYPEGDQVGTITTAFDAKNYSNHQEVMSGSVIALEPPTLMRQREGKPGGGKGPLLSEDVSLTIATNNDQTLFQPVEPTGVMGTVAHTLTHEGHDASEDGTGRGTPIIAVGFQPTDGGFAKFNNDEQSVTIKAADAPAVAYSIREDAKADNFSATEVETSRALQAHQPSVQSHHAQTFVATSTIVRRLTPTECERLQGFPDGWTTHRIDDDGTLTEQKDSARYKQMGNAVTVNVVAWIAHRFIAFENGELLPPDNVL